MGFRTLKETKQFIEAYFNRHKQVNSFFYGNDDDFNAIEKIYPAVQLEYISSPVSSKYIQYRYNISVQDLYDDNYPEMELDLHDAAMLVLRDFIAYLRVEGVDFSGANIVPFTDADVDRVAGATMAIVLQFPLEGNECHTPLNSNNTIIR